MRYSWIISLSLLIDLIFYADSAPPDFFEKNWLDRCDIKRLHLLSEATTKPFKPTRKPLPDSLPGSFGGMKLYKVNKHPRIDVFAPVEQLIKELKSKLTIDGLERGDSPEFGLPETKPRGFSDYENFFYGHDGQIDYEQYGALDVPYV